MIPPLPVRPAPAAAPRAASPQQALRRLLLDTLSQIGTLDVTDRVAVNVSCNLVQRLLGVLDEPEPELHLLAAQLHGAPATSRAALAAALYRELASLATGRFGVTAPAALDD